VGEQRINTAYFYAEYARAGSGPSAMMDTIEQNFGVRVDYYALIQMDGLVHVVDALGGVDITLEHKMAGLKRGQYHMDGQQALAFARERYSGDDFSRMQQGQILIRAIAVRMIQPASWPRLPGVLASLAGAVDTNIPFWQWPRLLFCLARAGILGVDSQTISPDMVYGFTTSGGGQVLAPNWEAINPFIEEMFGN
jgi:LCP family protein required for cell wall assembly